jgi:hypothetical protein
MRRTESQYELIESQYGLIESQWVRRTESQYGLIESQSAFDFLTVQYRLRWVRQCEITFTSGILFHIQHGSARLYKQTELLRRRRDVALT